MDGMLSQDEIQALLNTMDLSDDSASEQSDDSSISTNEGVATDAITASEELLSDVEKDAIGEVANISMGSSATTFSSLVNRKVNITTPVVTLATWDTLLEDYERPCVFIQIKYTQGLDGSNILVLKENDVKIITDLMMGGDGSNVEGELGELHLSAISEAMNQMMGSAATSLSTMLKTMIDISPPDSSLLDLTEYKNGGDIAPFLGGNFVKISFRMQIADLVDSSIMQLYPIEFARKLFDTFVGTQMEQITKAEESTKVAPEAPQNPSTSNMANHTMPNMNNMGMPQMDMNAMNVNSMNNMGMGQMGMPQMDMNAMNMNSMNNMGMGQMNMNPMMGGMSQMNMQNINIQPAQFQNFSNGSSNISGHENIGLIKDVPLEVTVELGRTSKSISEILNFAPGTIIELERIAGEPIDVLVNGKFVARGEVVVIEESFGVRVTEIIN